MMLITIPVFFPITQTLGIDPLYFGIFVVITNEFAMITPPVGLNLYIISGIGKIPIEKLIVSVIPYIICILVALYIVTLFPPLYLALPNAMMK
jgi:C4-dicarboxylate transporter DctM subunit